MGNEIHTNVQLAYSDMLIQHDENTQNTQNIDGIANTINQVPDFPPLPFTFTHNPSTSVPLQAQPEINTESRQIYENEIPEDHEFYEQFMNLFDEYAKVYVPTTYPNIPNFLQVVRLTQQINFEVTIISNLVYFVGPEERQAFIEDSEMD